MTEAVKLIIALVVVYVVVGVILMGILDGIMESCGYGMEGVEELYCTLLWPIVLVVVIVCGGYRLLEHTFRKLADGLKESKSRSKDEAE